MSDNKCPLCGKDVIEGEAFCRDCQEIANSSLSVELLSIEEKIIIVEETTEEVIIIENAKQEEPIFIAKQEDAIQKIPNSSKKKITLIISIIAVCLLIGGIGFYLYQKDKKVNEAEISFWDNCIEKNTPVAYSNYLVQYPEGQFSEQAHQKIRTLREQETKEWDELKTRGDINAYSAFLIDHPDTPHAGAIRSAMDSLGWVAALNENTAAAYQAYLDNVKLGAFTGDYQPLAQEKYDYLSQLRTIDGGELTAVKKTVTDFFKLLSSEKYDDLKEAMAPTLINFFDVENKSRDVITASIEADIKERKIKDMTYTTSADITDVIQDNKGIYFMEIPVVREITYSGRKRKQEATKLTLHIELNKDKKLQTLYEKKDLSK